MSDNNGWPSEPGVPMNPNQGGWHWLKESNSDMECVYWIAKPWLGDSRGCWETVGSEDNFEPCEISNWGYHGPCLKPEAADEIEKLRAALREIKRRTQDARPMSYVADYWRIANEALGENE